MLMKVKTTFVMPFRRRREGKTNFKKRLSYVKGGLPRLVVRRSNRGFVLQVIKYGEKGDLTVCGLHSSALSEVGFPAKCNTPTAYLAGMLIGKKALAKGVKQAVADLTGGTISRGSVLLAAVQGAVDAGMEIPIGGEKLVAERLNGAHLKLGDSVSAAKKKILS
jgi:large subunit ribosomal protein L18